MLLLVDLLVCLLWFILAKLMIRKPFIARKTDLILGTTLRLLSIPLTQVRLTKKEQSYHAAIFGRSGSGKSRLLQSIFLQHVAKGNGVGMIEPHHDLSFDSLSSLIAQGFFRRKDAYERLVYLDWGNGDFVPFNVLATRGDPHTIALNALDAMLRVWPELTEAPLFQTLFLSSVMTLIASGLPLTYLHKLLTDKAFRDDCLIQVSDPLVHETFEHFDQLGKDQPQAAGSTLRRSFLLSFSPLARYTLGQPENLLDFRTFMDEGTAVIINLGNIGDPETRKLLGAMLMVQIEQAALSRTNLLPNERKPFTLLVDEWPSFAAQQDTISHILSQCRKFNLRLYLAAQSLAQVPPGRLVGAMENCKLQVAFGLGRDSAETQAKHIGAADPMVIQEEQKTETQHNAFLPVMSQFEQWTQELQNLKPRWAYVKLESHHAIKMRTLGVPNEKVDPHELSDVLATYRRLYQRTQAQAEQAMRAVGLPKLKGMAREQEPAFATALDWEH